MQRAPAGNVSERIAARISVGRGVRHLADSDAIEHDPGHAAKGSGAHWMLAPLAFAAGAGCSRASSIRSVSMSTKRSGKKPFMRLTTSPFLLKMMVDGMEETCRRRERPSSKYTLCVQFCDCTNGFTSDRSSSVSTARNTTSSALLYLAFTCSYSGCWTRQGPHQV